MLKTISSHPVLLQSGKLTLFYYGAWMGMAYCAAKIVAVFHLSLYFQRNDVLNYYDVMNYYMFPAAIIGARAFSWVLEDDCNPKKIFRPGFWWHGGLTGTLFGMILGCYHYNIDLLFLLDSFGLSMPAFEIFNRMGCWSYGCCWGRIAPSSSSCCYSVQYKNKHSCIHRKNADCRNEHLYPVPLYAVALSAIQLIGMVLFVLGLNGERISSPTPGFLFLVGMVSSSVVRIICEYYRGDFRGAGVSSTKFFTIIQGIVAAAFYGWSLYHSHDSLREGVDINVGLYNGFKTCWNVLNSSVSNLGGTFVGAFFAYGTLFEV